MDDKPLINRLLSGIVIFKLKGEYIQVKPAKVEDKAFADFYAQEVYEDALLDGIFTTKDFEKLAIEKGWWSEKQEEKLKTITTNLDQMKVDYYNNFFKEDTRKYIKKSIDRQFKKIISLHEEKNPFFDKTCEYLRNFTRDALLLEKNTFLVKNNKKAVDTLRIDKIVWAYYKNMLSDKQIRNVAKSPEWRSLWNSTHSWAIFNNHGCELTSEQLNLTSWSRFYDNINESMDRPEQDIVDDDTAIDGWCIVQSRKRKEEDKKRRGEEMLSDNMQNAGEILIPVKNKREQENVLALNDSYGKSVLKSKKKQFAKGGSFKENELNHVKKDIQMEGFRQAKESRRR